MDSPHVGQLDTKPRCPVPGCGHLLDGFAQVGGDLPAMPKRGDVTLCAYCLRVLAFTDTGFHALSEAEFDRLPVQVQLELLRAGTWARAWSAMGKPLKVSKRPPARKVRTCSGSEFEAKPQPTSEPRAACCPTCMAPVVRLIRVREELLEALDRIAFAPFGQSDATHAEVLELITEFARLAKAKDRGAPWVMPTGAQQRSAAGRFDRPRRSAASSRTRCHAWPSSGAFASPASTAELRPPWKHSATRRCSARWASGGGSGRCSRSGGAGSCALSLGGGHDLGRYRPVRPLQARGAARGFRARPASAWLATGALR
jgi:hypothetical protein